MAQPAVNEIASRKLVELFEKMGSLAGEFDHWLGQSEEGGPLEKHHTQIRAVKCHLAGLHSKIAEQLKRARAGGTEKVLSACREMELVILAEHRIWEYFRSKYLQRSAEPFTPYLQAADEFAWACYSPVQAAAYPDPDSAGRKEPPLVFFNGGSSPFSVSRDRSFLPEPVPSEALTGPELTRVLKSLPIPVVGIPWYQLRHLPEALVIGHEVGHTVEDDFGLTEGLKGMLKAALEGGEQHERYPAWKSWLGEVFADFYGCLAGGPAYAGTLMDFLAVGAKRVTREKRTAKDWGRYPTAYLRILFVLKVIERMEFGECARRLRTLWVTAYPSHELAEFEQDVEPVADALYEGKHQTLGKTLPEIIRFTAGHQEDATLTAKKLEAVEDLESKDMLVLFAASRCAYERDPAAFVSMKYADKILNHIGKEVIKPGTRANEDPPTPEQLAKKDEKNLAGADQLFKDLHQKARRKARRVAK